MSFSINTSCKMNSSTYNVSTTPGMTLINSFSLDNHNAKNVSMNNSIERNQSPYIRNKKVLNDFKKTIQEAEKITSQIKFDSSSKYRITKQTFHENEPSEINHIEEPSTDSMTEDDLVSRLKISNEVLLKANIELKNKNKILTNEINQYKNSAIYKDPYSQYDTNLNEFIEDLKRSLEQSQQSNSELQELVEKTNKNCDNLSKSNAGLVKNFEICKNEYEKLTKDNSELKAFIQIRNKEIESLNQTINEQKDKIENMESMLLTNEKQINYLNTINSSNVQTQKEHENLIEQLKATIENLQKTNSNHFSNITELNSSIDQLNENLKTKITQIDSLQEELKAKCEENQNLNNKINSLEKTIAENKAMFLQNRNDLQSELFEKEKLKTQLEALNVYLLDRDKTIQSLQNSIAFLTKTFDNDLSNISNQGNSTTNMNSKDSANNDILNDLIKKLQTKINALKENNKKVTSEKEYLEKEINEYAEQFEQSKFDYQLLYQKYKEQSVLIDTLKNEFMNKRKDKQLNELIKANEEIMNKLQKIQEENKLKTKELNELRINYDRVNTQLMESQRISTQYYNTKENVNEDCNRTVPMISQNRYDYQINELEESHTSGYNSKRVKMNNSQS